MRGVMHVGTMQRVLNLQRSGRHFGLPVAAWLHVGSQHLFGIHWRPFTITDQCNLALTGLDWAVFYIPANTA